MAKRVIRIFVPAVSLAFVFSTCIAGIAVAVKEETPGIASRKQDADNPKGDARWR